jgi:hypothetical protein
MLKNLPKGLVAAAKLIIETTVPVQTRSVQQLDEGLKGDQHKIDANKNGKIDARDFELLRRKKAVKEALDSGVDVSDIIQFHSPMQSDLHEEIGVVIHRDARDGTIHVMAEGMKYKLKPGQVKEVSEELLGELSIGTMKSYGDKRARTVFSGGQKPGESVDAGIKRKSQQSNSLSLARTKINRVRDTGSTVLNKEEAEPVDEAHKINDRVEIVKGSGKGIVGHIGEIRRGAYKGAPKTYTVYHGEHGAEQVKKEHIRAIKENVLEEIEEGMELEFEDRGIATVVEITENRIVLAFDEGVEEFNIDDIDFKELDEARGRPPKPPKEGQKPSPAWQRHLERQNKGEDKEELEALGAQLRKAVSINKPVTFLNGEKKEVSPSHITKFEDHMEARPKTIDKQKFQNDAHASHDAFVKAVTSPVPKPQGGTSSIVKYR